MAKCNNKGKSVTIVKATNGKVFGGYTDLEFDGSGAWRDGNKNSFLFAFEENKIVKCRCINDRDEILTGRSSAIISFGNETLNIVTECNLKEEDNCAELGTYFE